MPFYFSFVDTITLHKNYDVFANEADVALIKITTCIDDANINSFIPAEPISLSSNAASTVENSKDKQQKKYKNDNNNNEGIVTVESDTNLDVLGLGVTTAGSSISDLPQILQIATVPYISNKDCKKYYDNSIEEGMIGVGYPKIGGIDAFQGDSGSGLVL